METLPLLSTAVGLVVTLSVTILSGMKWMLGRVEHRTDARFAEMDARFERMDARFDRMDARFDRMETRTDERFAEVGASLMEVKLGLARLEGPHPPFLIARG
ncbi:response regulator [Microbacterium sp. 20-116]|uniref:response regulator n=1 Tax=unclassified Microbacterium TaxID=2609290 RepID=UPI00226F271F|nr:response regulator [Microbacterium sp. SL75]WAC69472.1 response regulator [Microbacterium sp. SL75]